MSDDRTDEIPALCQRLVHACGALGLISERRGLGGVYAAMPGGGRLSEVVVCQADATGALQWCWSWGEPFCSASDVDSAAAMIRHVVTPAHA
jgi:hypothetical protein